MDIQIKKETSLNIDIELTCKNCGKELVCEYEVDDWGDISISVDKCKCEEA